MSEAPVLEMRGLTVERAGGGGPVLTSLDLKVEPRQVVGVIGESGAGKSVLARAAAGWLPAGLRRKAGAILFQGLDLATARAAELGRIRGNAIGYVGPSPATALDPTLSIGRQLVEKLRAVRPRIRQAEAREQIIALLASVGLSKPAERFDEYPAQFSGGMMQRVMIVDALSSDPTLLIADSVTQPLDATIASQILRLIAALASERSVAVLFVSSSFPAIAQISDEVAVLVRGRIVEQGAPRRVAAEPKSALTQEIVERIPKLWSIDAVNPPTGHEGDALVVVRDVAKSYAVKGSGLFDHREVKAVRGVSFEVATGENFGIVGESGCGKSTLTRLLACLEPPDRGSITFAGRDLAQAGRSEMLRLRRSFQLLLQDPYTALPPRHTIASIVAEPLAIHGMGETRARRRRALDALGEVGIESRLSEELPISLSAGQLQRVALARALVLEPKLLILDETLSALDPTEQARLINLFEKLQVSHSLTYVVVSHDLALVRRTCARVAVMYLGEVVELADNRTIFFDPGHPYTRALLAAAPTLEPNHFAREERLIEGEPPSPIDLPPGCSFASRCPRAIPRCSVTPPPVVVRDSNGARAACYFAPGASC